MGGQECCLMASRTASSSDKSPGSSPSAICWPAFLFHQARGDRCNLIGTRAQRARTRTIGVVRRAGPGEKSIAGGRMAAIETKSLLPARRPQHLGVRTAAEIVG